MRIKVINTMYKCNYCDKEVVDLPSHVKRTHADEYQKGKRAETYGKQVAEKPKAKTKTKTKTKTKSKPRKPKDESRIPMGVFQSARRNPARFARTKTRINKAILSLGLGQELTNKGIKVTELPVKKLKVNEDEA
jgi:ribosome-binding protein aMBF1 (putative translation factor)